MALPAIPSDPPSSTTATTPTPTPRLFTNAPPPPPPTTTTNPRPPPLIHHSQPPRYHHLHLPSSQPHYPPPQQQPRLPQLGSKQPQHFLYPLASSGRGFLHNPIRPPQLSDHTLAGFPGPPSYPHHYPVRSFGFPHSDLIRPPHLQNTLLGPAGGLVNGVPASTHQKVVPSQPSVSGSNSNGYNKDLRGRSRDDNLATVRDRKVRISEGSSLYALCRSWLRNGFPEESESQYVIGVNPLPRPSPAPVTDNHLQMKEEGDKEEEEEEESVELLSPTDLLKRHIKRAKKVRARLREERLQRIARYKTRLALLLPPLLEQQQLRNDMAAGN